MGNWTQGLKSFFKIFLQSSCSLCQRPAEGELCQYCQRQILGCKFPNPSFLWQGQLPVFAWGLYDGGLKRAIAALKYENQSHLAHTLGNSLGEAWLKSSGAVGIKKLTVVPIPIHAHKLQQRGFNQAELLAQSFCDFTGLALHRHGLERVRDTQAQFKLSVSERKKNLADAFILGKDFQRRLPTSSVLLLDDIYTSGTTAREAAKTLHQSGISVYAVVALAAPRKAGSNSNSLNP